MTDEIRWVHVFQGPLPEAVVLRGDLESRGIPAYVPDENTAVMDPFIRGGAIFDVGLLVPSDRVDEARQVLEASNAPETDEEWPADETLPTQAADGPGDPTEQRRDALRKLGRRIAFASFWVITAPYAFWLAWSRYFPTVRRYGVRPPNHAHVVAATAVAVLFTVVILIVAVGIPFREVFAFALSH